MMKNLIKRHLIWDLKLPAYYAAFAVVFTIACRLTDPLKDSAGGMFFNRLFFGIAISMAISTVINMLIRCWIRFNRTSYKDESYLYHTVPVSRARLYRSHLLSAVIAVTISAVFAGLCTLLLCYKPSFIIDLIKGAFSTPAWAATTVFMLTTLLMQVIVLLFCGIVGTTIGYSSDSSRTLKSVIFAALIYICICIAALLVGLTNPEIKAIFTEQEAAFSSSYWIIGSTQTAYYVIICAALAWIGKRLYLKKLNVD